MATPGKALWKNVEAIEAKDPYTVVIHLKEPSGSLLFGLGRPNNGAAIHPKEIIDAAGDGPDQGVHRHRPLPLRRAQARPPHQAGALQGLQRPAPRRRTATAGKRTAYLDEILFIPVPDVAVRLAGVETGEYHFASSIKQDQYDADQGPAPASTPRVVKPYGWITAVPNHKQGLMTNKKIRQAFQAALDMEPIMAAGFGNKDFYRLDPAPCSSRSSRVATPPPASTGYNQQEQGQGARAS